MQVILNRMSEYQIYTLPNGIRIAHKRVQNTKIVHCGIMFDIGSRDELPHQAGLAHFWEHMAFKGTKKRKSYHIINSLESVGGELNAYTTKEKICFYASVLDEYFVRAIDLLADIAFQSTFPEKQLELERGVILEEMSMYLDSPEDAIQDEFDGIIFPKHAMGVNILGTADSVKGFKREDFQRFIAENLDTERTVLSIVGNISFEKAIKVAERFLKDVPVVKTGRKRFAPNEYLPQNIRVKKDNNQAQVAIGSPSFSLSDSKRLPFFALVNLLGGPGMNSRFNLSLREKYGLVYQIEASLVSYSDTGLFSILFGTDHDNLNKAFKLVWKELNALKNKKLGSLQLKTLKDQLKGQLAMAEESKQGYMLMMAKSILDLGYVEPLQEIFSDIDRISAERLQDLAVESFNADYLSTLVYN